MAKHVVTGGAGFIGSHLVRRLVTDGNEVVVVDNLSTGSLSNLEGLEHRIRFVHGDIRNKELLESVFSGAQVVFHQAALVSVPKSVQNPLETHDVNVNGSLCVLAAARDSGVRRVVLASSCAVYGDSPVVPKEETMTPNPISPYACTKYIMEIYAKMYSDLYGLETVCLRYFNVYGPRQDPNSEYAAVVPKFISTMLHGEGPVIYGDGTQSRDFIFVDDVVEANIAASSVEGISGQTINVGTGLEHSINELVRLLNDILGMELVPLHRPRRDGDILRSAAATERARQMLDFAPKISLGEGLNKTVSWFRGNLIE